MLTTSSPFITPALKKGTYDDPHYEKPSITEPDNGHKTECLTKLDLKSETERLKTFENWKSEAVTPTELAKAGFYYLNNANNPDLVKCAFCKAEICRWEAGDDALEEHIKWSPSCPFLRDHIKSKERSLPFLCSQPSGQDVCGNAEVFPNSLPENHAFRLLRNMVRNPLEDKEARLKTFESWPESSKQQPAILAEAGFYYRGLEDHTICFECSGALRDWKDDDDPWEQHAMWFPACRFLLDTKGRKYVDEVQSKLNSSHVPSSNNLTKEANENKEKHSNGQGADALRELGIVTCKICDSNERKVIFTPCNHIIACEQCAAKMDRCPVCRKQIEGKMKVFLS